MHLPPDIRHSKMANAKTIVVVVVVVVVVDDDESVSRAICRQLRSVGITAASFPSGDAFLEALSSTPAPIRTIRNGRGTSNPDGARRC
jgi:CheY-like chemotaxis protein